MPCGGGVGRNIAEALWRLRNGKVRLLTTIGDDADGKYLENIVPGLILDDCVIKGASTATYAAILDANGECLLGLGDMGLHNHITIDLVNRHLKLLEQAPMVILDGNIPQSTLDHILKLCSKMEKTVFFEPTDQRKAIKPLINSHCLTYASPNLLELRAMANQLKPDFLVNSSGDINEILQLCKIVAKAIKFLIVTIGSKGVITVENCNNQYLKSRLYPVKLLKNIENVSGAGDCFASGFINGILRDHEQSCCISMGIEAARYALMSKNTVPEKLAVDITPNKVNFTTLQKM